MTICRGAVICPACPTLRLAGRIAERQGHDPVGHILRQARRAGAVILSIDEKSQIQALDRTRSGLPLKRGRAGTMTHDYKRHRKTTFFAAFDVLDGKVIGRCMQCNRHQEFIRFLSAVEPRSRPARPYRPSSTTTPPTRTGISSGRIGEGVWNTLFPEGLQPR